MKMKLTQPRHSGKLRKIRLVGMMLIQKPDDVGNSLVIVHTKTLSRFRRRAHPLLAAILAGVDDLRQLACERFGRFAVVLITPNDKFEHLSADIATSPHSSTPTPAS